MRDVDRAGGREVSEQEARDVANGGVTLKRPRATDAGRA